MNLKIKKVWFLALVALALGASSNVFALEPLWAIHGINCSPKNTVIMVVTWGDGAFTHTFVLPPRKGGGCTNETLYLPVQDQVPATVNATWIDSAGRSGTCPTKTYTDLTGKAIDVHFSVSANGECI